MWGEYEEKGLVILALSSESKGLVKKHIAENGMTYPIAAGCRASRDYGVRGIPAAFLIDHTGTIIWQGNPHKSDWYEMLDEALAKALLMADSWDLGERPSYMKAAIAAAEDGNMGKVWKEIVRMQEAFAEEPLKLLDIGKLQSDFEVRAEVRTKHGNSFAELGCYQEAANYLSLQVKLFKGAPVAETWTAEMSSWKKDAEIKTLLALDKKRLKAISMAYAGKAEKAKKDLRSLHDKARGTRIEKAVDDAYDLVSSMLRKS